MWDAAKTTAAVRHEATTRATMTRSRMLVLEALSLSIDARTRA
jgi:hypothetical protein